MLTLTAPQKTIFHKIPAGQKLLALCVISVADCTCVPNNCNGRSVSFARAFICKIWGAHALAALAICADHWHISWHHKRYRGRLRNHPAYVDRCCACKRGDNDHTAK